MKAFVKTLTTVLNTVSIKNKEYRQEKKYRLGNLTVTRRVVNGEWLDEYDLPFDQWNIEAIVQDMVKILTL